MEILPDSTQQTLNDQTSSQEASPVKISAPPDYAQVSPDPAAASGENSCAFFAVARHGSRPRGKRGRAALPQ
jgi:hypothetical protein